MVVLKVVLKVVIIEFNYLIKKRKCVAKQKYDRSIINNAIKKSLREKKEVSQLTIKIDSRLDNALVILSEKINVSKNKLIENILFESGIIEEVEENYYE